MIILVRHGRTAINAAGKLQGRIDLPLDEVGVRQAAAVGAALGDVDRVISSPLLRARQSAEAFGAPIEVDERWIELDYGLFDNVLPSELPAEVAAGLRNDSGFAPEGGESLDDVAKRVWPACEELLAEAAESNVVVVSHVAPIKVAVAWALGVGIEISWRSQLSQGSVCRVAAGASGPVLWSFNETPWTGIA